MITLGQLQLAGLSASAVRKRATSGRLCRLYRGVYAVGHAPLTADGRVMAAVLAYGERAVASHRTAAWLHGLRADNRARIELSVRVPSIRSRPGIDAHASPTLRADHITRCHGIPCTTVARTALDLAELVPRRQVERVLEQAMVQRVFDRRAFDAVLDNANGHRGAGVLRGVLAGLVDEPGLTASELEERFLELCRAAGLPSPEVNQWLRIDDGEPIKADFLWRRERVVVEVDGWAAHGTRVAFERDRLRDQRVRLARWEPIRLTRRQVLGEPERVIGTVAALLAR